MNAVFVLKSVWVFLLGVAVAVTGLLCLLFRPDIGTNSFIIMLMGLFFTGAGSIYGKRKLRGEPPVLAPGEKAEHPFRLLQTRPLPIREVPVGGLSEEKKPSGTGTKKIPDEEFLEIAEEAIESGSAEVPAGEQAESRSESAASEKTETPEPEIQKTRVVKIVVCPKCGAENEPKDKFCYNCGFRLKPKKRKKKKPAKQMKKSAKQAKKPKKQKTKEPAKPKESVPEEFETI